MTKREETEIETRLTAFIYTFHPNFPRLRSCSANFVAQRVTEKLLKKEHGAPAENHLEMVKSLFRKKISTR